MVVEAFSPKKHQVVSRTIIRRAGRFLYKRFSTPEIEGIENIPDEGPYLITINHLSVFDPPFVIPFWPVAPTPLGAIELWTERGKALLTRMYGAIPIDRDRYDRSALERVVLTLQSGIPILMAPEGRITRVPGLRRAKLGVAYILEKARVPVVPVGIVGGTPDFLERALRGKKPAIKMRVGLPYNLPYEKVLQFSKKEAYQVLADYVMAKVAAVLPEDYRGFYCEYDRFTQLLDLPMVSNDEKYSRQNSD